MCFGRKKKLAQEPVLEAETVEQATVDKVIKPMEVFLDISMVPVAPPKSTGVLRPEVLPEEFVLYKDKKN